MDLAELTTIGIVGNAANCTTEEEVEQILRLDAGLGRANNNERKQE